MIRDEDEEWRMVESAPNYEVSNKGRVRNIKTGHIMSHMVNQHIWGNVPFVKLIEYDGKRRPKAVNQLVATAFIPNPEGYKKVIHLDDDYHNLDADNLFWGDQKDYWNVKFNLGEEHYNTGIAIGSFDEDGNLVKRYKSIRHAAYFTPYPYKTFYYFVANPENHDKTLNGYYWRYLD